MKTQFHTRQKGALFVFFPFSELGTVRKPTESPRFYRDSAFIKDRFLAKMGLQMVHQHAPLESSTGTIDQSGIFPAPDS